MNAQFYPPPSFCLVLGLAARRTRAQQEASDLLAYFPGTYVKAKHIVIGLFILAELARRGVKLDERDVVQKISQENLDPKDQTSLTDAAMNKLNEYAAGGFDLLRQSIGHPPERTETFLVSYHQLLQRTLAQADNEAA